MRAHTPRVMKLALELVLSVALVLMGVALGGFPAWGEKNYGRKWNLQNSEGRRVLIRHIYEVYPMIESIRKFAESNKRAPSESELLAVGSLSDAYLDAMFAGKNAWYYSIGGPGSLEFGLYLKLNWDASLNFDSSSDQWTYDPGDGRPLTALHP